MTTMTAGAEPGARLLAGLKGKGRQCAPLAAIVVLHLVLFYALQNGMLRQVVHAALPDVITISFVAPPEQAKPRPPAPPKMTRLSAQLSPPQPRTIAPPLPQLAVAPDAPGIAAPQPAEAAPVAAAPPAPATPAPPRTVASAEYLTAPQAVYPNISRRLGESGTVMLRILINAKGLPEQVTVHKTSGFANLDEAGRQAVLRALFKPLMENGKPVPVFVIVPINFQLS